MGVVRATDGTLSAPVPLPHGQDPAQRIAGLGMDDGGDAVAVWTEGDWYDGTPRLAGYDGAGPQLGGLPASGAVGQPLSFSAGALDVWSGVASVDWSFGDGASATGDTVAHVSESGTVRATVLGRRLGVRSGRRCVGPRRHRRRSATRCSRSVRVAMRSTHLDIEGVGSLAIATKRLRPGRYTVVVEAEDPSGNRSDPVTLHLTVLPRKRR